MMNIKILTVCLMLIVPLIVLSQDLKHKAPNGTMYIDIAKEGTKEEIYDYLSEWLLDNNFMIEFRDPELYLIRTEAFERGSHMSYYTFRIKDGRITLSGNFRQSSSSVALWGTGLNARDSFKQIKKVSGMGQQSARNSFNDMQFVAELLGEKLTFRK